jgi:hypothetical protein
VGPGQCFGELALLTGDNRACNVMALDSSKVLTLHREAFHQLLGSLEALRHLWRYEALRRVPLMDQLPEKSKMEVAAALAQLSTPKGSAVVTQVGMCECTWQQALSGTLLCVQSCMLQVSWMCLVGFLLGTCDKEVQYKQSNPNVFRLAGENYHAVIRGLFSGPTISGLNHGLSCQLFCRETYTCWEILWCWTSAQ